MQPEWRIYLRNHTEQKLQQSVMLYEIFLHKILGLAYFIEIFDDVFWPKLRLERFWRIWRILSFKIMTSGADEDWTRRSYAKSFIIRFRWQVQIFTDKNKYNLTSYFGRQHLKTYKSIQTNIQFRFRYFFKSSLK